MVMTSSPLERTEASAMRWLLEQLVKEVADDRMNCENLVRAAMTAGSVLIIEDEPDIAKVLRYSLGKAGFNMRAVLTGEEGLNASLERTNPPSLILLDLLLPGMMGWKFAADQRVPSLAFDAPTVRSAWTGPSLPTSGRSAVADHQAPWASQSSA